MKKLLMEAKKAREKAHAPYSKFKVGAAIECASGKIYTGCNIESWSFSPSCCAERVALYKAISNGERKFRRLAIVTDTKEPATPCGVCRQVLSEFAPSIEIVMGNTKGRSRTMNISQLLPFAYEKEK